MKLWHNGEIKDVEGAKIPLTWMSPRISSGVFDGARGYWNTQRQQLYMFCLGEHIDRFCQGCRVQQLHFGFSADELHRAALEVIGTNHFTEDMYIAPTAFLGVDIAVGGNPNLRAGAEVFLCCRTWPSTLGGREPIDCAISSWQRIADHAMPPRVKCFANYNNYRLATLEANRNGYPDYFSAIMLNQRGKVAEGAMAALFFIRRGQVITPSVGSDILESITRAVAIQLFAEALGMPVCERDVDRTELYAADEVFLCGTGSEIIPVKSVDRYPVGDGVEAGPITRRLAQLFEDVVRGVDQRYGAWRTPV